MPNNKLIFFILVNVNAFEKKIKEIKIYLMMLDFSKRNLNFQVKYIGNFQKINSFKGFSTL